jgi:glycerophosphoryl diester phosphodiesterase
MTPSTFMVIAHRGASSCAPENTLAAFDLAIRMGVRHIEFDVHSSRDGHLVVIHDDTLDRTTNGSGPVSNHTLGALRELDAGSWFGAAFAGERVPTFDDVLSRYGGRIHIHAEIKGHSASLSQQTADLVRQHDLATGWLVPEVSDAVIAQARAMGLRQICPRAGTVTPELVNRLHAEGWVVRAWGVATEALMQQVVAAGADGMTVNFPDKLIAYLAHVSTSR